MNRALLLRQYAPVVIMISIAALLSVNLHPVAYIQDYLRLHPTLEKQHLDDVILSFICSLIMILIFGIYQIKRLYSVELKLSKHRIKHENLLENLPLAVVEFDSEQKARITNQTFNQYSQQMGGTAAKALVERLFNKLNALGNATEITLKQCYPDTGNGHQLCIEWQLHRANGSFLLLGRDISQQLEIQDRLSISERILENTPIGVMVTGADQCIEYVNRAFQQVTGYSPDEVVGQDPSLLSSGKYDHDFFKSMYSSLNEDGYWQGEIWNRRKNGDIYLEWLSIIALKDDFDQITHYIGMFSEITAQEHVREKLRTLAYYDALTSLANRSLFNDQLERLIQKQSNKKLCVVFIDLDAFKRINDSLGHHVGDQLLATFAKRLKYSTRSTDIVARWGGDEFIIAIEVSDSHHGIARFCSKQLKLLDAPFTLDGRELNVTASVGVSIYGEDAQNATELIRNADIAMYQAKRRGKNRYEIFSSQLHKEISESIEIENRLRLAICNSRIDVYFQPQISLKNEDVIGLEALARWTDKELGSVSPQKFIAVAENTGQIGELGALIFSKACEQFKPWHDSNPCLTLSVNLSASQLQNDELISLLREAICKYCIDPQQIKLEITEDVFMSDIEKSIHTTSQLKEIGFQISLDDFGTGYSSLSYLKDFDIDELKIDRSFVESLQTSERNRALVAAMVVMAEILAIDCIVEGVETKQQFLELQKLGCTLFQGYLFHKPMPADDIELVLQQGPLLSSNLLWTRTFRSEEFFPSDNR